GIALAILGAGLFFGAPNLFQSSSAAIPEQVRNRALALILYHTHILSVAILAAAGLHLLVHAVLVFRDARQRRPLRRTDIAPGAFAGRPALEKRDRFFGPCWNLPFCRDTVKRRCPILHSRQPCWRKGRGCYCDNEIVITLSGERLAGSRPTAAGFIKPQEIQPRKVLDARTKRQQCLGCPIYLYHQDHKYRVLAPLVVLGVIAFVAYNKARLDALYPEVVRGLGRALSGLSYSPANRTGVPAWAEDLAQTTGVEWLLLVVGTVLLIAYLVHAVEWILYKWGI
ncbi:MAG: hypothetical protein HY320_13025, partial [Armatimonadetes bacterium]|nr:hypothetical protein [Armatimonadota bacterium]